MFSLGELYRGKKTGLNCKDMQKKSIGEKIITTILGLFLCLVLLELGLRVAGFAFSFLQQHRNRVSVQPKGTYRIMCVGESTTALGGQNSYPYQLQEILNQRNIGRQFSVINAGIPSGNSTAILAELEDNLNTYRPNMILAMMGINDGEDYTPYKETVGSKAAYFSGAFRTYKLVKLLWFYVMDRNAVATDNYSRQNIADVINNSTQPKNRKEVEDVFRRVWTGNNPGYFLLVSADRYAREGRWKEAGECYEKLIEQGFQKEMMALEPKNCGVYYGLGESYKRQGRFKDAEEVYKKIVKIRADMGYLELAILYKEQGEEKLAGEYFSKAKKFREEYYSPMTYRNYQRLKEILTLKGIELVCVQYPTRNIGPLKKMLEPAEGIIFVDNEMLFKKALEKYGFEKYFDDSCYGDFGHCSKEGNMLLAENIADVILSQVFLVKSKGIINNAQNTEQVDEQYLLKRGRFATFR